MPTHARELSKPGRATRTARCARPAPPPRPVAPETRLQSLGFRQHEDLLPFGTRTSPLAHLRATTKGEWSAVTNSAPLPESRDEINRPSTANEGTPHAYNR